MPGSDYFKGAAQTRISGTPIFSSTEGNSAQHINHTHNYHNSTVNIYYSGPPTVNPITAQSRSPVNDDMNDPDQRQTTTTIRSPPNGQAPSNGLSREEERAERPSGELEQAGNPPADGNGPEIMITDNFAQYTDFPRDPLGSFAL
ncbi:hypothetical protein V5O48_017483 [Marasmius crinis-equi]|uniref:Uncharacterized protein n=1 Tax=Marasmius crinis-equi TaxID=585013 RepID=A0ABR3ENU6_9AGAR